MGSSKTWFTERDRANVADAVEACRRGDYSQIGLVRAYHGRFGERRTQDQFKIGYDQIEKWTSAAKQPQAA